FIELGKTQRAADYVRLDAGSEWAAYVAPSILLREGKTAEAREAVKRMPTAPRFHRDLLEACLQMRPASELDRLAHDAETNPPAEPDPEIWYYQGALFGYCGKKQAALRMLESALSVLGIAVGVAAFICVVGIGNASTSAVEDQLKSLGDNFIWIEAGSRSRNGIRMGSRGIRTLVLWGRGCYSAAGATHQTHLA